MLLHRIHIHLLIIYVLLLILVLITELISTHQLFFWSLYHMKRCNLSILLIEALHGLFV